MDTIIRQAVTEEARGHGLGQKLLEECLKWMKENGIKRVKLHAYSWNTSAKKLYENMVLWNMQCPMRLF